MPFDAWNELVTELEPRLDLILHWLRVAETEQAHQGKPLHAHAGRDPQVAEIELVVGAVAAAIAELRVAQVVRLARVDEGTNPRARCKLYGQRDDRFELRREAGVTAEGIAERIARPQRAVAEAAHRIAAAGEDVLVRRAVVSPNAVP